MSYFLFGAIEFVAVGEVNQDEAAWRACEVGVEVRLSALLGPNVRQGSVRDVLIAQALTGGEHLPFLLTASPFRDTSEELLLPNGWPNDSDGLLRLMGRVERWIGALLEVNGVERVVLFICEGYDDEFVELDSCVSEFADRVLAQIDDPAWLPSVRVSVRRGSSLVG